MIVKINKIRKSLSAPSDLKTLFESRFGYDGNTTDKYFKSRFFMDASESIKLNVVNDTKAYLGGVDGGLFKPTNLITSAAGAIDDNLSKVSDTLSSGAGLLTMKAISKNENLTLGEFLTGLNGITSAVDYRLAEDTIFKGEVIYDAFASGVQIYESSEVNRSLTLELNMDYSLYKDSDSAFKKYLEDNIFIRSLVDPYDNTGLYNSENRDVEFDDIEVENESVADSSPNAELVAFADGNLGIVFQTLTSDILSNMDEFLISDAINNAKSLCKYLNDLKLNFDEFYFNFRKIISSAAMDSFYFNYYLDDNNTLIFFAVSFRDDDYNKSIEKYYDITSNQIALEVEPNNYRYDRYILPQQFSSFNHTAWIISGLNRTVGANVSFLYLGEDLFSAKYLEEGIPEFVDAKLNYININSLKENTYEAETIENNTLNYFAEDRFNFMYANKDMTKSKKIKILKDYFYNIGYAPKILINESNEALLKLFYDDWKLTDDMFGEKDVDNANSNIVTDYIANSKIVKTVIDFVQESKLNTPSPVDIEYYPVYKNNQIKSTPITYRSFVASGCSYKQSHKCFEYRDMVVPYNISYTVTLEPAMNHTFEKLAFDTFNISKKLVPTINPNIEGLDTPLESIIDQVTNLVDIIFDNEDGIGQVSVEFDVLSGSYSHTNMIDIGDMIKGIENTKEELNELGGILTTSGGLRYLNQKITSNRSSISFHYLGRAFDLYINHGMVDILNDPYVITKDGDYWIVWARVTEGDDITLNNVYTYEKRKGTLSTTGKFVNLTEILLDNGFSRIKPRRSFWRDGDNSSAEWWHFQYDSDLTSESTFGQLLIDCWSYDKVKNNDIYLNSKDKKFSGGTFK